MFVIRKDQMDAMAKAREADFADRMVRHLRGHFADHLARLGIREGLPALVLRGISAAKGYGVTGEADVRRYLELSAILGPGFDGDRRFGWAGETLRKEGLDGTAKMDVLTEHLIFAARGPS
jgi:hypothetical protein